MDTRDTAEQAELRRTARALVTGLAPGGVADLDDPVRRSRLARAVSEAGWTELRDDAGDGAPVASGVEAGIVAEALGRGVADVPLVGPLLAADLARRAGTSVEPGAVIVADADLLDPALVGAAGAVAVDADQAATAAYALVSEGDGYRLARVATTGIAPGTDLTRLVAGVAPAPIADPIGGVLDAEDLTGWRALGLALTSADLVGVMRGVLDLTVAYATDRHQYGKAIGSFQAVQHLLAEAWTLMEGSYSVALHAGWAVDALDPVDACAAGRVAKAYCARAARTACETAIQVHGGIGNTWDCLAHVYLRRALLSTAWFGDDGEQLRALESERWAVASGLS